MSSGVSVPLQDLQNVKNKIMKGMRNLTVEDQLSTLRSTFSTAFNAVKTSGVDTTYRTIACDTLAIWISRSIQILNKHSEYKVEFESFLTEERSTFIFYYVIDFWNDSGAALGNALKELFVKMLNYLSLMLPNNIKNDLCASWLSKSLKIPYTTRALYFMIEHLYKHVEPKKFIITEKPNFIDDCLSNIWSRALGSIVGKSIYLVLRYNYNENHEDEWLSMWTPQVIKHLNDVKLRKGVESYLLPNLFSVSKKATIRFLRILIEEDVDTHILLSTLKVAQENAIVTEPFLEIDVTTGKPLIDINDIKSLLKENTASYRIGAFQLLVSSPKLSKQISPVVYDAVRDSFDMVFMDSDLETRNEIFACLKRFITRIKDSTYALHRDAISLTKKDFKRFESEIKEKNKAVLQGKAFFDYLLRYIEDNLRPGASFLRKEMSYKLLLVLIKSGLDSRVSTKYLEKMKRVEFSYSIDIYDSKLIRLVVDNILDNFDDIRRFSTEVVTMSPLPLEDLVDMKILEARAFEMLGDIKGKEVDSSARFFKFSFSYYQDSDNIAKCLNILTSLNLKIKHSIKMAHDDLATSCISYSIQGYFAAFKFIFEILDLKKFETYLSEMNLLSDLIKEWIQIWDIVKHILQHDSPEGLLLDGFQSNYTAEQEIKYGKATQVISSYAWRSIKESTNMLDSLFIYQNSLIDNNHVRIIGNTLLDQLATIRHRGAFSAVFPTFVLCCKLCTKRDDIESLPEQWLNENLSLIQTRSKYITRRSAGIPFLITAILSSNKTMISSTFQKLVGIAKSPIQELNTSDFDNVNLPQVNAFNCIKAIFIDSALSEESVAFVDDAFELSLSCFGSQYWSIRNCAVMLFTALQNRLFSSKKVKANYLPSYPARLFFEKFPTIHSLFYTALKDSINLGLNDPTQIEKVFPILTILSRLEPTPGYNGLDDFIPLVLEILNNKTWKVREMAARSLPSMISDAKAFKCIIIKLFENVHEDNKDLNNVHGSLLAIKEIIINFKELATEDIEQTVGKLLIKDNTERLEILSKTEMVLNDIHCYPIKLAYFQLLKLLDVNLENGDDKLLLTLSEWFVNNSNIDKKLNGSKQLALKELSELLFGNVDDASIIKECLFSPMYELQLSCIKYYESQLETQTIDKNVKQILIASIWKLLADKTSWKFVKSQSLKLLKGLIVKVGNENDNPVDLEEHTNQLIQLLVSESNEDIRLSVIETLGSYVARSMIANNSDDGCNFDLWINKIKLMQSDELEYTIRISALNSLIAFNEIYMNDGMDEVIKLRITGYIFEYLKDDDESICQLASLHLSKNVLQLKNFDILPTEVEKLMIHYFIRIEQLLLLQELIRLDEGFKFLNKDANFEDILKQDSLLFSSEKTNLERNPTDKVMELVHIIDNTRLKESPEAFMEINSLLVRNLADITKYFKSDDAFVDGCFGLLSLEGPFDMLYCSLILFRCLKSHGLIDYDISELEILLKSSERQIHPLILDVL